MGDGGRSKWLEHLFQKLDRWFGETKGKKEGFHPRARLNQSKWLEGARSSILEGIKL